MAEYLSPSFLRVPQGSRQSWEELANRESPPSFCERVRNSSRLPAIQLNHAWSDLPPEFTIILRGAIFSSCWINPSCCSNEIPLSSISWSKYFRHFRFCSFRPVGWSTDGLYVVYWYWERSCFVQVSTRLQYSSGLLNSSGCTNITSSGSNRPPNASAAFFGMASDRREYSSNRPAYPIEDFWSDWSTSVLTRLTVILFGSARRLCAPVIEFLISLAWWDRWDVCWSIRSTTWTACSVSSMNLATIKQIGLSTSLWWENSPSGSRSNRLRISPL